MSYEIIGNVKVINEAVTRGTKGFTFRSFVIEVGDKYPQMIQMECQGKSVPMLEQIRLGDNVKAKFDVRGREYNGKYYTTLVAWNVSQEHAEFAPSIPQEPRTITEQGQGKASDANEAYDDTSVPF